MIAVPAIDQYLISQYAASTAADRVQTGLDRTAAAASAVTATTQASNAAASAVTAAASTNLVNLILMGF